MSTDRPRRFHLERDHDVSGVSGTGHVANGVLWPDGTVSLRWIGDRPSTVHWDRLEDAEYVHGHNGATRIVWADETQTIGLASVLAEIRAERGRQDEQWGEQNHPDGTGPTLEVLPGWHARDLADAARASCQLHADMGIVTWRDIFGEETCEVLAENDLVKLRAELVQAVAVGVAWIEAIDRRVTEEQPS